jgi:hypothetical protein
MHAEWRKSSFSGAGQQDCVEVAYSNRVRVRDSKNAEASALAVPAASWAPRRLAALR